MFREACVHCSLLRPDPAQRERLVEIRDNLIARITEAEQQGWLGEIEGLQVSLTGAESKIRQIDDSSPASGPPVHLGLPTSRKSQVSVWNSVQDARADKDTDVPPTAGRTRPTRNNSGGWL